MKINALNINGFGVWHDLRLDQIPNGITVFYGPNEAGKTTLLQFIRAMFYGFTPIHRGRYLPPHAGGRPGGSLRLADHRGEFHLDRYDDEPERRSEGVLSIRAADGTPHVDAHLGSLLAGIDEALFHNVFAIGLRELQELGTLDDTQAAQYLYNLSTGLDRVSLSEVLRELKSSRSRLLSDEDRPSQIVQLTSERDRLKQELEELGSSTRDYGRLSRQREQLFKQIARVDEEKRSLDEEIRLIELATKIHPRWQQRSSLQTQLAALGELAAFPDGAAEELDELNERIRTRAEVTS